MTFIATFFSHFGAVRYLKLCEKKGYKAVIMPVPRSLSSSCGTCVKYDAEEALMDPSHDEIEKMVKCVSDRYENVYMADNI